MPNEGLRRREEENPFDAQFAQKERLNLPGGMADIIDVRPENPKTETPVLLAPGWGLTDKVYQPAIQELVKRGRRVISLNHPRIGGDMSAAPQEALDKYPTEEVRKALNLIDLLDQKGIEKTDVIAHSEGAINTCIAAVLHPEKFRNIVFYAPAGLIGEDTFTRLLKGFAGQMKRAETLSAAEGRPEIPKTKTEKHVAAVAATECLKYLAIDKTL